MKITDLSKASISSPVMEFVVSANQVSQRLSVGDLVAGIKKELGYYPQVLKKCIHCGQWGAVMCACPACGAPIDP